MQGLVKSSMILVLMLLMFLRLLKKNIKQEAFFPENNTDTFKHTEYQLQ